MHNKKIFISHSLKDNDIVKGFIYLLNSFGIHQIYCNYFSDTSLPDGETIYQYLRRQNNNDSYVLYFLSENYYSSTACLNEMGALWVSTTAEHGLALLLDDYELPDIQGAIDLRDSCIKLSQLDVTERIASLISDIFTFLELSPRKLLTEDHRKIADFITQFATLTEDSDHYFYSTILETRTTEYWPEAQLIKIEKNIPPNLLEEKIDFGNESHWLVYLNGLDRPILPNDYVKFKITGKSKFYKEKNDRSIYLSDIVIL